MREEKTDWEGGRWGMEEKAEGALLGVGAWFSSEFSSGSELIVDKEEEESIWFDLSVFSSYINFRNWLENHTKLN